MVRVVGGQCGHVTNIQMLDVHLSNFMTLAVRCGDWIIRSDENV